MTKKVNIYSSRPITVLAVPIRGNINAAVLDVEQIRKIICANGIVDEILEDGSLVRLNFTNYNKDNSSESVKAKAAAIKKAEAAAAEAKRLVEEAAAKAKKEAQEKLLAKEKASKEAAIANAKEEAKLEAERKSKLIAEKRAAIETAKAKQYKK